MNLLELIGLKHFDFEYKGEHDLITPHWVHYLVNKIEEITNYFDDNYNYDFDSIDKLIDYFSISAFSQFAFVPQEMIDNEPDEQRKDIFEKRNVIIAFLQSKLSSFNENKLPKYLIENAKDFFRDDDRRNIYLVEKIIDCACTFGKGVKSVFVNLMDSIYKIFLLRRFDKVKDLIISDDQMLNLFLTKYEPIASGFYSQVNSIFLSAVSVIYYKKNKDKNLIKPIVDNVVTFINDVCKKNVVKDWIVNKTELNRAIIFLRSIGNTKVAELQEKIKRYNKNEAEYFANYGYTHKGKPFSLEPMAKVFEDPNISMISKIFYVTHQELGKHFSRSFSRNKQPSVTEMLFPTANPLSDTFSMSFQQGVSISNQIYCNVLAILLNKCKPFDIFQSLFDELSLIIKEYKFFDYAAEDAENDIQLLFSYFDMLDYNKSIAMEEIIDARSKPLYYGACVLICALIEKLLNSLVKSGKKDMYIEKHLTLGNFFQPTTDIPDYLKRVLSEPLFNYVKYMIWFEEDKVKQAKVGRDLRNRLVHYDDCINKINYGNVMALLLTYMSIINELVSKKAKKPKK